MRRRCAACGGPARLVRVDPFGADRVVEHYRCADVRAGCRSGGSRVLERADDAVVATDGPVFDPPRGERRE